MSRHTENDGKTPDIRIRQGDSFDLHLPELGPSPRLIGSYYRDRLPWEEFVERYQTEMEGEKQQMAMEDLAERARTKKVSLLCIEPTCDQCHRRLLAQMMKKRFPFLDVTYDWNGNRD